jgi:hypothetical protein
VERGLPGAGWSGQFGRDAAWFPDLLEVIPRDPLSNTGGPGTLIATMTAGAEWLALWNGERIAGLRHARDAMRILLGGWLGLTFILGAFALARLPFPTRGRILFIAASALLGAATPLAIAIGAWQAGLPEFAPQNLLIAALAGLLLAGGVGAMLRLRGSAAGDPALPHAPRALDYSIQEAPDERNW